LKGGGCENKSKTRNLTEFTSTFLDRAISSLVHAITSTTIASKLLLVLVVLKNGSDEQCVCVGASSNIKESE
jgi:hypothetical protein